MLRALIALLLLFATPFSQAFAGEADPLLGAWRYRNENGKVVSMVLVHQFYTGMKNTCNYFSKML